MKYFKSQHGIDDPSKHRGIVGATEDNLLSVDDKGLPKDSGAAASALHAKQHAITSASDHTSSATSGQMLKADANGLPVDGTNTDTDVADAVSKRHTQNTDTKIESGTTKVEVGATTIDENCNGNAVRDVDTDGETKFSQNVGWLVEALTYAATVTADWGTGNFKKMTFGAGDVTTFNFTDPNNPCRLTLQLTQDGTGGRSVATWDADIIWMDATEPDLAGMGANEVCIISFVWDGTKYRGDSGAMFAS